MTPIAANVIATTRCAGRENDSEGKVPAVHHMSAPVNSATSGGGTLSSTYFMPL